MNELSKKVFWEN